MTRRFWLAALIATAILIGLVPIASAAPPPLPTSIAAVGDSITQAASTGGFDEQFGQLDAILAAL